MMMIAARLLTRDDGAILIREVAGLSPDSGTNSYCLTSINNDNKKTP